MAMVCGEDSVEVAESWHSMAEGLICAKGRLDAAGEAVKEVSRAEPSSSPYSLTLSSTGLPYP